MGRDPLADPYPRKPLKGRFAPFSESAAQEERGPAAGPAPLPGRYFGDERDAARAAAGRRTDPHRPELPPDGRADRRARRGGRDGARPEPADGDLRRRRRAGALLDRRGESRSSSAARSRPARCSPSPSSTTRRRLRAPLRRGGFVQELDVPVVRGRIFSATRAGAPASSRASSRRSRGSCSPPSRTTSSATTPGALSLPAARAVRTHCCR